MKTLGGMKPIRVKIHTLPILCLLFAIAYLMVFPPSFIGDYNVRISLFLLVVLVFQVIFATIPQVFSGNNRAIITAFAVSCILFPVITVYFLSSFSSWCCVSTGDFDRLCNLADRTASILEQNKIPYWVCWGSLLGATRESNLPYQSIPWEHDFDLCVHDKDWERMAEALAANPTIKFDPVKRGVYDTSYRTTMARAYVDLYRYTPTADNMYLETREGSHEIKRTLTTAILPHKPITVCNRKFSGPADPVQTIKDIYGDGYLERRWPPGLTGFTCRLHADCELPNGMPV